MTRFILFFALAFICSHASAAANVADSLFINLKSGESLSPHSIELKSPALKAKYLLVNNSQKVELNFINSYQDNTGYYLQATVDKLNKEYLLKRETEGEINMYSRLISNAGTHGANGMYTGGGSSKIYYIQKNSGNILSFSYENAKNVMNDNPLSMKKLKSVNTVRNLKYLGYIIGGGLTLVGGYKTIASTDSSLPPSMQGDVKISPLLYAGSAVFAIPLLVNVNINAKLLSALKIYNGH